MPSPPPIRIGIFDSGIGGLSVLRAVRRRLPRADCCYIADARHTPWGDRPTAWVTARCTQLAGWLIADGADLVLVACNTGTTQAIAALRQRWPQLPFVGVEPGIKPAVAASQNGRVAVMATTGTLRSARLQQLVATHAGQTSVLRLPCPGLVEAIEQAGTDDSGLRRQLDALAHTLRAAEVDTVVLGCTHYPLVGDALQQRLGPGVQLVDTAEAVARRVASLLPSPGGVPETGTAPHGAGRLRLLNTADPDTLTRAAQRWVQADAQAEALWLPDPDIQDGIPAAARP